MPLHSTFKGVIMFLFIAKGNTGKEDANVNWEDTKKCFRYKN